MKLPLAYLGDSFLRKKCEKVDVIDAEIHKLVDDMVETLIEHNGIGLSAPQVKIAKRIFITAVPIEKPDGTWQSGTLRCFINPEILSVSELTESQSEGCLSIPKLFAIVERPIKVTVKATDLNNNIFEEQFSGLEARCVLHENDHLNGVLFIDRIPKAERKKLEIALREIKKKFQN